MTKLGDLTVYPYTVTYGAFNKCTNAVKKYDSSNIFTLGNRKNPHFQCPLSRKTSVLDTYDTLNPKNRQLKLIIFMLEYRNQPIDLECLAPDMVLRSALSITTDPVSNPMFVSKSISVSDPDSTRAVDPEGQK
jgi:hypothetical protein